MHQAAFALCDFMALSGVARGLKVLDLGSGPGLTGGLTTLTLTQTHPAVGWPVNTSAPGQG